MAQPRGIYAINCLIGVNISILADIYLEHHVFSKMEIPLLRTSSLEHPA